MSLRVKSLHFYPVKSLQGHNIQKAEIDAFGLHLDRRFMLVNDAGKFVTQRHYPKLSLLKCSVEGDKVFIRGDEIGELCFHRQEQSSHIESVVWGDSVDALELFSDDVGKLSEYLGVGVRLVFMPDSSFRQVDRQFFDNDQRVGFADGFPILLTHQSSLDDLNNRLVSPIGMHRFRPNIVIEGGEAYAEDGWSRLRIGEVDFAVVKPCSRCVMTTVESGEKGTEPLRTLSTFRKNEFGVCFGQNLVQLNRGIIQVGDKVLIDS